MDVKTAGRTVEVFEIFAQAQEPLSLSEIARALNAPLSSSLYLIRALEQRGYLYNVGKGKHLYPTRKLLKISRSIAAGEYWVGRVEPVLLDLRDSTNETVVLASRQRGHIISLAVHESRQDVRFATSVGTTRPLHTSAIGRALLSLLSPKDRAAALEETSRQFPDIPIDHDQLKVDLEEVVQRGYADAPGNEATDLMGIAKAFRVGDEQFGIAIAGPTERIKANAARHVDLLSKAVQKIVEARY